MSDLKGQQGYMTATIHITRKATGKTETHSLILTPIESTEAKEYTNGSNPLDGSAQRSD
jgi:hypothetical protein